MENANNYNENDIQVLEGLEAVRKRPGMYIGKLGDGSHSDDGIYVLIKETIDNCIDEFRMNEGKVVEVSVSAPSAEDNSQRVRVRDYGRGVPFGIREDGENVTQLIADDGKIISREVPPQVMRKFEASGIVDPFSR